MRDPKGMGEPEGRTFLTHLAVQRNVSAATQNHALNALVFLYRHVIGREFDLLEGGKCAKRIPRVPVVLSAGAGGQRPARCGLVLLVPD
jgi:hypothetical protein